MTSEISSAPELIYYCEFDPNNWDDRLEITFSNEHVITFTPSSFDEKKMVINVNIQDNNLQFPGDFFGGNILNVTAIAGKNGLGKTNIFKRIFYFGSCLKLESIKIFKDRELNKFYIEADKVDFFHEANVIHLENDVSANPNNSILFYNVFLKREVGNTVANESANKLFVKPSQLVDSDSTLYFLLKNLDEESPSGILEGVGKFFKGDLRAQSLSVRFLNFSMMKNLQEREKSLYEYAKEINKNQDKFNQNDVFQFVFLLNLLEFEFRINKRPTAIRMGSFSENIFQSVDKSSLLEEVNKDIINFLRNKSLLIVSPKIKSGVTDGMVFGKVFNKILNDFNKLPSEIMYISDGQLILDLSQVEYKQEIFDFIVELEVIKDNLFDVGDEELIEILLGTYSAGERQILYFFAAIFHKISNIESSNDVTGCSKKLIILVIDEYEQNLHPEWVRIFFSALLDFLDYMGKKDPRILFQIIFSTHSPYLISDLPKENIRLIEKDKETGKRKVSKPKHSFASNYYDILSDSFFLEDTIGEFAKQKINGWITELNELEESSDSDLEKLTRIDGLIALIHIVDDQFIRNKLLELAEDVKRRIEERDDKDLQKYLLDQQIAELQKRRKALDLEDNDD